MRTQDPRLFTFHLQISAGLIYLVICLIVGDVALPQTAKGWGGLIALPLFYAASTLGFFGAIALIGSIRASLLMNLEPVFTIAAGFLILSQVLTPLQLAGAALVIGAVLAVRIEKGATRKRETPDSVLVSLSNLALRLSRNASIPARASLLVWVSAEATDSVNSPFLSRHVGDAADRADRHHVHHRRVTGDRLGELDRLVQRLALPHKVVRQAERLTLLGGDPASGQHHLGGAAGADDARDPHRCPAADEDAALALGELVDRARLGDSHMGCGRDLQPASHHRALHGGRPRAARRTPPSSSVRCQ